MKNRRQLWSRALASGCAFGLMFLAAGDAARTQVVTPAIGIDPLGILDLQIKPNVLIVLDTSGSMRFPPGLNNAGNPNNAGSADVQIGGDDNNAKMHQAKDALNQVLDANAGRFNFGFATYGLRNDDKSLTQPGFQDSNRSVGPLTYVSIDANADTWTGGGTDYFTASASSAINYTGVGAGNVYDSFRPFNEVYGGPGCAAGTDCRRYLFSRLLRDNLEFRFDTASTTGLQSGFPAAFTCPKPPAGLFPQDPNVDADPTTSDIRRPCFKLSSTAAGNPSATFFYTSGMWELNAGTSACSAAAVLENVAACASANVPTIKAFLKPEMPIDGSCGDAVGVPCKMTSFIDTGAGTSTFQGTNPANPSANSLLGVLAAQGTPLGGVLSNVRTNFSTYFPNVIAGQRNLVLLLTDGDESCGGAPATEALTNYNAATRIETLVIGFGLNTATLNLIARNGSGGKLDAFTAANAQELVNALNSALQQTSITGEFSDQQTITESVFEYGATAGIDPRDPDVRYSKLIPLLLQSTFEMPGFVGHLNAFRNNAGASLQVWDAGDKLCRRVTGFPATTTAPASCDTAAASVDTTALGTINTYVFAELVPATSGAPNYSPTGCSGLATNGTRCIHRRIFATTRNGVFPYAAAVTPGATQQPSDTGPTAPLWPPSQVAGGVDPPKSGTTYPNGVLDVGLGIDTMDFTTLQNTFGVCRNTGGDPLPADCTDATARASFARKEARQMILAFAAGAQPVRASNGITRRALNATGTNAYRSAQIRYTARTWMLGDATLSGPAVVTPPLESQPAIGQPEYALYKDGPRTSSGTPNAAPADQIAKGFGLRNPDRDSNAATKATSKADVNLKPVMSIVYYGANDMLHAFRAGPQCAVIGATTCTTAFETGGDELWGFVPFDLLGQLRLIVTQGQDRANHKYFFTTAVRFGDVFIPATFTDPNGVSRSGKWRTLLYVGRGIGGKYMTALDVTSAGVFTQTSLSTAAPLTLWNRGNPDTQDGTVGGTANKTSPDDGVSDWSVTGGTASGAYATMGQTWSVPALARVDPAATTNFGRNFILYVGSGYGAAGEGRNFYSLDPVTGDILTAADVGSSTGSLIADNVIVANPAVFAKELLRPASITNPSAQIASRVYVGDVHGRMWKFLTSAAGTPIRVRDFGVDQPIANAVALLSYNGDGSGEKPHLYVEMGNDRRVPAPPALPPPPIFQLAGLQDNGSDTDTAQDNASLLFSIDLPDRFRGTVQPATAFNDVTATASARVFMAATRFNPVTSTNCQSSFDSIVFAVGAQTGNAAFDLDASGAVDALDRAKLLTGKRVNAVQVAFGQVTIDQGLAAQNAPPPPAPPPTPISSTVNQVFTLGVNAAGSAVCRY